MQYEHLLLLAEQVRKPLSVMICEAVVEQYLAQLDVQKRQQALDNLLALDAPVSDWSQMEFD